MRLYQFPFSHFCEKARWALEICEIEYQRENLLPGFHRLTLNLKGAKGSVPVLQTGTELIDGSTEIINFALKYGTSKNLSQATGPEALAWHDRLNTDGGASIQTLLYEALLKKPETLLKMWSTDQFSHAFYKIGFAAISASVGILYNINAKGIEAANERLNHLLYDLDQIFAKQEFLLGEEFSCVDLSLAALLSPLAMPKQHDFASRFIELGVDKALNPMAEKFAHYQTPTRIREFYSRFRKRE